VAKLLTI